jgi:hypothetical protein
MVPISDANSTECYKGEFMKMLMALVTFLIVLSAHSIELQSAQLSQDQKSIEIIIKIQVDGAKRKFGLKNIICQETFPAQCLSELDVIAEGPSQPLNRHLITNELINLEEQGLDDPYYKNATVTIRDEDSKRSVTVSLP